MKTILIIMTVAALATTSLNTAAQAIKTEPMKNTYQAYKSQNDSLLRQYDSRILVLKNQQFANTDDRDFFYKRVDSLTKRNLELRNRLDNYKETDKAQWSSFQKKFDSDLKELEFSMKDMNTREKQQVKARRDSM